MKDKGLGDTIQRITKATGIDKVAKAVLGDDCGCEERKEKLNKMFPYNKVRQFTEDELKIYEEVLPRLKSGTIRYTSCMAEGKKKYGIYKIKKRS